MINIKILKEARKLIADKQCYYIRRGEKFEPVIDRERVKARLADLDRMIEERK